MKNKIKYIITGILAFGLFSCQDQTDVYQDFVDASKDKVYPGKVVNPVAYSGQNRIKIEITKPLDPSVSEVRIFWNFYTDSISVPLNESDVRKEIILNDMPEQSYSFIIKTYDAKRNVSVPMEVFGNSYGASYQNRITNRPLQTKVLDATTNTLTLTFGSADVSSGAFQTTVSYTDLSNNTVTKILDVGSSVLVISNYKSGAMYSTQYKPEPTCLDVFSTASTNVF